MVVKKNRVLTHLFLIFFTIIVLFPLIWVVSTSIRRDNAAFSPKLFSSRITFRNYKDLIFPQPNVPELINEMDKSIHYIGDYANLSLEKNKRVFSKYIKRMNKLLNLTENRLERISKDFDEIDRILKGEHKKLENNMIKDFSDIQSSINETYVAIKNIVPNELKGRIKEKEILYVNSMKEYFDNLKKIILILDDFKDLKSQEFIYLNDTYTYLLNIPPKYTIWKIKVLRKWKKITKRDLNDLEDYSKSLYNKWKELNKIKSDIDNEIQNFIREKYSQVISQYEELQDDINKVNLQVRKLTFIENDLKESYIKNSEKIENSILIFYPELKKLEVAYDNLKDDLRKREYDENIQDQILFDLYTALKTYSRITSTTRFVKIIEILDWLAKSANNLKKKSEDYEIKVILELSEIIKEKYSKVKDELSNLIDESEQVVNEIYKVQNERENLKKELEELQKRFESVKQIYESKVQKLKVLDEYTNLVFINNFNEVDEITFYKIFVISKMISKGFIQSIRVKPEKLKALLWFEKYNNAKVNFIQGSRILINQIELYKNKISEIEDKYNFILEYNYTTPKTKISVFEELMESYDSSFGKFNAYLSKSSRMLSDVADVISIGKVKSVLRKMDNQLYNIAQDWTKKIRKPFLRWLLNSIIVSGFTAVFTVLITAFAAYPFSRMRFIGRKQGLLFLLIIQMFPAIMYMVAFYGLLKFFGEYIGFLGLDSLGGLIFLYLGGIAFNMYLIKGFYDTIPDTLEEAAMIDGATRFQTFWRIVLPLAAPVLAVVTILSFMGTFNEFVLAKIVLQSEQNYTYAVGLQTFSTGPFETEWGMFTAASLIGAVPMVILFLSMQKYLVGGLTKGAVKG